MQCGMPDFRQPFQKLVLDSFELFPTTEIFSKRRKIYSLYLGNQSNDFTTVRDYINLIYPYIYRISQTAQSV